MKKIIVCWIAICASLAGAIELMTGAAAPPVSAVAKQGEGPIPLPPAKMYVTARNELIKLPRGAVQCFNLGESGFIVGAQRMYHGTFRHPALAGGQGEFWLDGAIVVGGTFDPDLPQGYLQYWPKAGAAVYPMVCDIEIDIPIAQMWAAMDKMRSLRPGWPCGIYNVWGRDNNGPFFERVASKADFTNVGLQRQLELSRAAKARGEKIDETHFLRREIRWAKAMAPKLPCVANVLAIDDASRPRPDRDIRLETRICREEGAIPNLFWADQPSAEMNRIVIMMLQELQ